MITKLDISNSMLSSSYRTFFCLSPYARYQSWLVSLRNPGQLQNYTKPVEPFLSRIGHPMEHSDIIRRRECQLTDSQHPRLVAFEFTPKSSATNLLLWISGLTEGLLSPSYVKDIAKALPESWSTAQIVLSSSYTGWGSSSLRKDAEEIAQCVSYFRGIKSGKIVLMGHSTGCQDVIHYLVGKDENNDPNPFVDGGILQAPVSDREAMDKFMDPELFRMSVKIAHDMVKAGKGEDMMPSISNSNFFGDACCARRWLSLTSPTGEGEDDLFSSYLSDETLRKSFGALPKKTPISVLYSGADIYVPDWVDKAQLVSKWKNVAERGGSTIHDESWAVIAGASHNYMGDPSEVVGNMVDKVVDFLQWLETQQSV